MPIKKSKAQIKLERDKRQQQEKVISKLKKSIASVKLFNVQDSTPSPQTCVLPTNVRYQMDVTTKIPSNNTPTKSHRKVKVDLTPEMLAREQLARVELKRKSQRLAPLYNKGAYQYISDETDLTTLGKKI